MDGEDRDIAKEPEMEGTFWGRASSSTVLFFSSAEMSLSLFDRIASQWFEPMTLSSSNPTPDPQTMEWHSVHCAGALVLLVYRVLDGRGDELFITNVLTKSSRKLTVPTLPGARASYLGPNEDGPDLVSFTADSHSYRVVIMYFAIDFFQAMPESMCIHIYDSKSHTWESNLVKSIFQRDLHDLFQIHNSCAYMDGKLFILATYHQSEEGKSETLKLCLYDVDYNDWSSVYEFDDENSDLRCCGTLRCGDRVIVVLSSDDIVFAEIEKSLQTGNTNDVKAIQKYSFLYTRKKSIKIFQLDLQTKELVWMSDGPPEVMMVLGKSKLGGVHELPLTFSSDANSVYFGRHSFQGSVIRFDLNSEEWSWIPPPSCSSYSYLVDGVFDPALNLAV